MTTWRRRVHVQKKLAARVSAVVEIWLQFNQDCDEMHDDVELWNAPSECHNLVEAGNDRRKHELEKKLGYSYQQFVADLTKVVSYRWAYMHGLV